VKKRRAFVLDDSESARALLREQLREFGGYEVFVFADGEELIEHLKNDGDVDILLLDINLPGQAMDGLEVGNEIRRLGYDIPILFVTSDVREGVVKAIRKMGCGHDIVEKGLGAEKLFNACDALIHQSKMLTKIGSVEADTREIKEIVKAFRPEAILNVVKEEICAVSHAGLVTTEQLSKELEPTKLVSRWRKNLLVVAVVGLAAIICGATVEWLRYTYNLSNSNSRELGAVKAVIRQIPEQMQRQDAKIDKILDQVKRNHGDNP
jgi:CheY-like chemotaxis protein